MEIIYEDVTDSFNLKWLVKLIPPRALAHIAYLTGQVCGTVIHCRLGPKNRI